MVSVTDCANGGGIPTGGNFTHPRSFCDGGIHNGKDLDSIDEELLKHIIGAQIVAFHKGQDVGKRSKT